ncbi:unnamed protein product [Didymodactylos carnosus]|uniref:Uncharacterized protein n=1 Tax=Didymodactylos carnosus TaxID=1234261 RepID=A0A813WHI0_9BILA|nr:unnamed protein product [Didymodactylos carnosus]CAF3638963.1 unnamed protein product [Didymodactylos carnosus]
MNNSARNERKRPISQRTSLPPAKRFSTITSSSCSLSRQQTRSNDRKIATPKSTPTSKENSRKQTPLSPSYLRRSERCESSSSSSVHSTEKTKYSSSLPSSSHDRYPKSNSKLDNRLSRNSRRRASRSSSSSRSSSLERRDRTVRNATAQKTTIEIKNGDDDFSSLPMSKDTCATRSSTLRPLNDLQKQPSSMNEIKAIPATKTDIPIAVSSENNSKKIIAIDKPYKKPTTQLPSQTHQPVEAKNPFNVAVLSPSAQTITQKKEEKSSRLGTLSKPSTIKTQERKIVLTQTSVKEQNGTKITLSELKCNKSSDDKDKTITMTSAVKEKKNENSKIYHGLVDYPDESEDETDKHKHQRQCEKQGDKPISTDCNNNNDLLKKRSTDNVIIQPPNTNIDDKKLPKKVNLKVLKLVSQTASVTTPTVITANNIKMLSSDNLFSSALRVPTKIKLTKTIEQQEDKKPNNSNNAVIFERKKSISYASPDLLSDTSLNTTYECEKEECLSIKKDENHFKPDALDESLSIVSDTVSLTSVSIPQTKLKITQQEENNEQIPLSPPSSIKSPLIKNEYNTQTYAYEKSDEAQDLNISNVEQEAEKISSIAVTSPQVVDDKPQDNFHIPPTIELSPNSLSSSPDLSSNSFSDDEKKAMNSYKRRYRSLSSSLAACFDCRPSLSSTTPVKSKSLTRIKPLPSSTMLSAKQDEIVCENNQQEPQLERKLTIEKQLNKTKVSNGRIIKITKRQYKKRQSAVSRIQQQTQPIEDDEERSAIIKAVMDQLIRSTEMEMVNFLLMAKRSTATDRNQLVTSYCEYSSKPLSLNVEQPPIFNTTLLSTLSTSNKQLSLEENKSLEFSSTTVKNTINCNENVEMTKVAQCNHECPINCYQHHAVASSPLVQEDIAVSSGRQPVVLTEIQLDELAYLLHANVHRSDIEKISDTNKVEERMRDLWRSMSTTKKKAYYTRVLNLHKRPNRGVVVVPADEIGNSTTPILQPPTTSVSPSTITPPLSSTPTSTINPFVSTHRSPSPLLFQSISTPVNVEFDMLMQKNDTSPSQKQHPQEQIIEIAPSIAYVDPQQSKSFIFKDIIDELIKGSKGLDKLCQPSSVLNSIQHFIQSSQEKQIDTLKKLEKDAEKKCAIQFTRATLFWRQRVTYFLTKHSSTAVIEYTNEIERIVKYYYLLVLCKYLFWKCSLDNKFLFLFFLKALNFRRQEKEFENTLTTFMNEKLTFKDTLRSSTITDILNELANNPLLSNDFLSSQSIVINNIEYALPSIHNTELECEIIEQMKNDDVVETTISFLDVDEVANFLSCCDRMFSMTHSNMNACAAPYCSHYPPQQPMFNQYQQPILPQQYTNNVCYFASPPLSTMNPAMNYFESPYILAHESTHPSYYNPSLYPATQYSVIQQSQQQQQQQQQQYYQSFQQHAFDCYYPSTTVGCQTQHHNPFHHAQQQQYHQQLEADVSFRRAASLNRKYTYSNNAQQQQQLTATTVASSTTTQAMSPT